MLCRERKSYQEQVETLNKQMADDKKQQDGLKSRVGDLEKKLHDAGEACLCVAALSSFIPLRTLQPYRELGSCLGCSLAATVSFPDAAGQCLQ